MSCLKDSKAHIIHIILALSNANAAVSRIKFLLAFLLALFLTFYASGCPERAPKLPTVKSSPGNRSLMLVTRFLFVYCIYLAKHNFTYVILEQ